MGAFLFHAEAPSGLRLPLRLRRPAAHWFEGIRISTVAPG